MKRNHASRITFSLYCRFLISPMPSDLLSFLWWFLASSAAGLLALPLAFRLFRHLPDRGYTLARPLGLLAAGYGFWLLGSLGFLRNDVGGIIFAALLVGALGVAWLRGGGLRELGQWLRAARPVVVGVEALFLLAFAGMAYVRAHNPEILGTEKPMEYMFINSILRSPTFPPQDAWLAGHAISYYYFGYLLVAALARLTATDSAVAFNLALALLFALTAVASLGVVMNLIALARGYGRDAQFAPTPGPSPSGRGETDSPPSPSPITNHQFLITSFAPALLAPLLVLIVGNFYGLVQFAYQNGLAADLRLPVARYHFGANDPTNLGSTAGQDPLASTPGLRVGLVNVWDWLDLKETQEPAPRPAEWRWDTGGAWFFAARVVHDRNLLGNEVEAIDENPAFSFLLGDLHPHVLALPFVVLAAGLALEWLLWACASARPAGADAPARFDSGTSFGLTLSDFRHPTALLRLLLSAVILGGLAFLNTWDFPIYLFLTVLATALGYGLGHGRAALAAALPRLAALAVGLAVVSVLLYLPFYVTFQSQAGGLLPNLIWPTRFQQVFVFFGPVLIGVTVYLLWLAYRGRSRLDRRAALWAGLGLVVALILAATALALAGTLSSLSSFVDNAIAPLSRQQALSLLLQRRLVDSLATLFPALLIALAAGLAWGWLARPHEPAAAAAPAAASPTGRGWRRRAVPAQAANEPLVASPAVLMVLAMIATGALLMLGPEYLYLRDNFGLRMNTIFKFYFQTWTLWALAAAFGAWHLARLARPAVRVAGGVALWLGALGGLVTTATSLDAKTGGFAAAAPTLDGMAWFARQYPNDWAAIQWLRQNVEGTPVILEAYGGAYNIEEGRVSMATGFPTLMGWTNHEGQWRGDYYGQVAGRPAQVTTVYQARDWSATLDVLNQYGVEYVVVGGEERQQYSPIFFPKFEQFMDTVFETGDMTIYRRKPLQAQ